jgi:hypothetical protein
MKSGTIIWTLFSFNRKMLLMILLLQQRMMSLPQVSLRWLKQPKMTKIRRRNLSQWRRRKKLSQRNKRKKRKRRRSL